MPLALRRAARRLLFALCLAAPAAMAQDQGPVPESRVAISRNVDFYGADLANIFDTTLDACQAACLADSRCRAFTYNERSGACFPKEDVSRIEPYDGAVSARVYPTASAVLDRVPARVARLDFLTAGDLGAARRLAVDIGRLHAVDENTAEELIRAAQSRRAAADLSGAFRLTGAAVALTDQPDLWTEYARLARTANFGDDTRAIRARALPAAINGYLRALSDPAQVNALIEMAQALKAEDRGRRMIDALRLAQSIQPRRDAEALLDDAIGKYGFRVAETQVDSDAAQPRICAVFNEELVRTGFDYAPYVRLPDPALTVSAEGSQICIDGVRHGSRYSITLREGLPAASGETLARPVDLTLYVRDRAPSLRFTSRAYVLPRMGEVAIPVEAVNLEEAALTLYRVSDRAIVGAIQDDLFARPLYQWEQDRFESQVGVEIWSGTATLPMELNRDVTARLPMEGAVAGQPAGVYVLRAAIPGADPWEEPLAYQWFILSDHGITTMQGVDGLTVAVRSLGDASATEGAEVQLLSRANAVLGEAVTDAAGIARLAPGLTRGTGAAEPALVTVARGDDMAFLSLTGPAFDLSDRGVEGREPAPPIDVFLATDRGAYRPGETIHVTALMRDEEARALSGVPLTAILSRPDGVEYSRHVSTVDLSGGHVFDLPVAASAPRGPWTVALHADPEAEPLRATRVLVEDFLPERIDVELDLPEVLPATGGVMEVAARYLFGAPGADLAIEGEARLSPTRTLADWPGYVFGRHDDRPGPRATSFGGTRTGPDGMAQVALDLEVPEAPGWPLDLSVAARVSEASGRPVERHATARVQPQGDLIGIHTGFDGTLPENGTASFRLIGLDRDLASTPMEVAWTVNRVTTRYQWYRIDGSWNWEPITSRERVATGTAALGTAPVEVSAPVTWGAYEIVVERTDGAYLASSESFTAGWYVPEDGGATPDFLDLSLDAESYAVGDTATLRIVPRYAGTALITVMSNRVIHMEAVEVPEGASVIPLEVTADWGAGAYVTASVIRPMEAATGRNPARSLGLVHAQVAPGDRALSVTLVAPAEAAPRGPLEIGIAVDAAAGETAHVTLAAVDVGILNLTGFESPDPQGHYFGQRRLGVELRDLYGRLIDGSQGVPGQIRSGGDAMADMGTEAPPPTEELPAFFSGPVTVGADGRATVAFDLPAFNGTVRLMAVAWSDRGVGRAEAEVLVRDPIVVNASVPRFLAPGDRTEMLLELTHATGPVGALGLTLDAEGLALAGGVDQQLEIGEGETLRLRLPLAAVDVGDHALTVGLTTPDGTVLTRDLTIPVRLNDPEVSRTSRFTLAAGETFTFDDQVFDGLRGGTATLSVGPLARFDAPGLLATLDRYPYGCTEQVTSQALPLLYFDGVAQAMDLAGADEVATRIDQAITEVLANQDRNGAFGLWRPGSGDLWLDAYVTDFLSRARGLGHDVPDRAFEAAIDNVRNRVNTYPDFDAGGGDLAYGLMVLAREGAASIGDLRYYADQKAEAFGTPIALAQLGAALAFYGEQARADALFARAGRLVEARLAVEEANLWRADYGTDHRDAAAVLTLAVEAGSTAVDRDRLAASLARAGERVSTQEAAWTLLATHALADDLQGAGITVDGLAPDGPVLRVRAADTATAPVAIANTGERETELTVTTFGVPEVPEPAGGNGYAIRREYYTLDGAARDLAGLTPGERLVAVLTVTPFGRQEARLMVDDPLPAGLEIDNPNLLQAGDIGALGWLETAPTESAEFRADRFLAALDRRTDEPFRLAYIVRAVSPGDYHHPAATVEDMYRPQMRAWTGTGRMSVAE